VDAFPALINDPLGSAAMSIDGLGVLAASTKRKLVPSDL
jgi:hypothetical protein